MANKHAWFLTINNPTEVDLELCRWATTSSLENRRHFTVDGNYSHKHTEHIVSNKGLPVKGLAYFGYAQEVGKQGTPHIHCMVIFKNAKSFVALKKLFPRANIQPVRGTFQECLDYIRKDGRYHSISFVPKERCLQYVTNDNKLAQLALEGDVTISRLEDRITNLEAKLDKLIFLISHKKILNTLLPEEEVL